MEVLKIMEYNEKYAREQGQENIAYDWVVAQRIMKTIYRSEELIDLVWLEKISNDENSSI
jgi:hypothetical protein